MDHLLSRHPDTALLCLGSLFEALHQRAEREDAVLDGLAAQILEERPKTLIGLAVTAAAQKWLRRHLWVVEVDTLGPYDWAVRVVIDSAMRLDCTCP
jgi:hypothetical protein